MRPLNTLAKIIRRRNRALDQATRRHDIDYRDTRKADEEWVTPGELAGILTAMKSCAADLIDL